MYRHSGICVALVAIVLAVGAPRWAAAQEEFPPPSGKGRVVVVLSGATGSGNYRHMAQRFATLGYNVVLFDSNAILAARAGGSSEMPVRAALEKALQMPHSLPGPVAVVGFSQGGGMALAWATIMSDQVAVVAGWYPATDWPQMKDPKGFASRLRVPVVMFAGTADEYKFCCMIGKARELHAAAQAANASFELVEYKGVRHGFSIEGVEYDRGTTNDAFARTAATLKRYLK
jgi:dienelactone hydrolase